MNIRKFIAGILAFCIVGGVMPDVKNMTSNNLITANAETYEQLTYTIYDDYIEISGCDSSAKEVVIPSEIEGLPVESIGDEAFYGCSGLTSVIIPEGVTSIGARAFSQCLNLISVTIPESVTSIGDWAFFECIKLTSVTIPEGVTSIGKGTFSFCTGLTSVTIPEGVTSIGDDAFYECSGLTSVTIPESVTSIGEQAFYECSGLTSVTIPESVTSIGDWSFFECSGLTSITILNPECDISAYSGTIYKKATIYGYDNSTAQAYAKEYNREFISLGKTPETTSESDIKATLLGDANEDGEVNIADATAIVQHLGNKDKYGLSEQGLINADCCNVGDGVTGLDALALQRLEAKQINKLPYTE